MSDQSNVILISDDDSRDEKGILSTSTQLTTPDQCRKRSRYGNRSNYPKPLTPSSDVKSFMNASLVFDMVTSLSTNDPGIAIATLRSIVVLGKEYPSNLLYDELMERIISVDVVSYGDAVSIYSSLIFVFDRAMSCSCPITFPYHFDTLSRALQNMAEKPIDSVWTRNLLVIQFLIYCFKQDFHNLEIQYDGDSSKWIQKSRLYKVLINEEHSDKRKKQKVMNQLILQTISCCMNIWVKIHASNEATDIEEGCIAILRLVEMLCMVTDQVSNVLQRIQAGLSDLPHYARVKFSQAIQSPELKVQLGIAVVGLTNKSRSKEFEWYECNVVGRINRSVVGGDPCLYTESYSVSHWRSFADAAPRNDFTRLMQEICNLEMK